ncbi:MAG: hypothetical protein HGA87_01425 [Desulfobulbaceae bacterium]|nr:hypothetical protein [Desulfobulbaceae bacterium]
MNYYDALNPQPIDQQDAVEEVRLRELEISKDFAACFGTEAGMKVLEYLKSKTLDIPAWVPGESVHQAFAREGQNSIVRLIIERINHAKQ